MSSLLNVWIICIYLANFTAGYENLAIRKPAWQSSNYKNKKWFAENAVDGEKSQQANNGSCAVAEGRKSNTWRVDLGRQLSINDIKIYYRYESDHYWESTSKGRFAGFSVYVSNTTSKDEGHLCFHNTDTPTRVENIECVVHGRYVIYYNDRNGDSYPDYYSTYIFNELCEVEVFGCGYYGADCIEPCPTNCKDKKCDIFNGSCASCVDGYQGEFCNLKNLALRKPAWQSSNFDSNHPASAGVDGNRAQTFASSSCAVAKKSKSNTWRVDLGAVLTIHNIDIYYRLDNNWEHFVGRFAGFYLYVSNTTDKTGGYLCFHNTERPNSVMTMECVVSGRYVIVYNERKNGDPVYYHPYVFNELCEVEVYGCGFYGFDCIMPCPANCMDKKCDEINGSCTSCVDGYQGNFCNQTCDEFFYGQQCRLKCGNCFDGDKCFHVNGICIKGCAAGWQGIRCDTQCDPGRFGQNCSQSCNTNCYSTTNRLCDHQTGKCTSGCKPGYKGDQCDKECDPGRFGQDCSEICNENCYNTTNRLCDHETGKCTSGCKLGYKGDQCDKECDVHFYGNKCNSSCGNCLNGETCNHVTGICQNGCEPGWKENTCQEKCDLGTFGHGCRSICSATCLVSENSVCDHVAGNCSNGCLDGWEGRYCDEACKDHFYGNQCKDECGNCLGQVTCHHINGTCNDGCAAGWKGTTCQDTCEPGTYGLNCNRICSENCYYNARPLCDKVLGHCTHGCFPGWQGEKCNSACDDYFFGTQCEQVCGNCSDNGKCHHVNGICSNGCAAGWKGNTCHNECEETSYGKNCLLNCSTNCVNRTCNSVSGICIMTLPLKNDMINAASVAGGVVGGLLLASGLIVIIMILFRRYRNKDGNPYKEVMDNQTNANSKPPRNDFTNIYVNVTTKDCKQKEEKTIKDFEIDKDDEVQENIYTNASTKVNSFPDIYIDQLEKFISEKRDKGDDDFESDYQSLPYGESSPCNVGKMENNLKKNRYKTTFPYDHSRVILKTDSNHCDDYINANFIDGVEKENMYIASQGPKSNTIEDFWRMVWQENVTQIIMLTNLKEGPKFKCAQYWPKGDGNLKVGQYSLKKIEHKDYAYFVVRKLTLQNTETNKSRTVTQYHYTAWPDHGIPDPLCLVIFHNQVSKTVTDKNAPVVVHCSAGIGRTGTYIALDALYKTGLQTKQINIPEYIKTMRKNRMNMVQTTDQYITIFLALSEAFKAPINVTRIAEFADHFEKMTNDVPTNQSGLMNEFQTLLKIRPKYTDADFKTAQQNKVSREPVSVLPLARYILYLTTSVPKRGSYINAITVPSFLRLKSFIITPYPTKDTVVDFLRLITDHESSTVVVMDPVRQIECSDIWLPGESENTVNPFNIRTESFSSIDNIETRVVLLSNITTDKQPKTLSVIAPRIPISVGKGEDTSTLRGLVSTVMNIGQEPFTVMSSDGASLCGLFGAVFSAIQQMTLDNAVDIFTIVRQLQVRRPEFCSTMDEYYTCYQAIADYLLYTSENLYCNN